MLRLRVREVADAKGISRTRLSQRPKISYSVIKEIFRDSYRVIKTDTLQRLAAALRVPVTELIEEVPEEQWRRETGQTS
ncbi:helix-turn-helix domain-containing protein [Thermogemmatispora onikobensis]|uniref:helix-turn-helix domain-containing protein n=1 Tax=Thermogemmatispora onikobensis TaxID=732234 RepID=UPI0008537AF8